MNRSYRQPIKQLARSVLIESAVTALTTGRKSSPVVTVSQFEQMLEYCLVQAKPYCKSSLRDALLPFCEEWGEVHSARVGTRKSSELKVLFLSGPEPLNDFNEFAKHGISPTNIWAIEGDRDTFRAAATQLSNANVPCKLHFGSLHEFFAVVPEQFDIVYFDACGPLFSKASRPDIVIRELFLNQRLSPLSALITNFACTTADNMTLWCDRLWSWYAARYDQPVFHESEEIDRVHAPEAFRDHIQRNIDEYYSDFVTRFLLEFSSHLMPWWRVWALKAARRAYFSDKTILGEATAETLRSGDLASDDLQALLNSIGHAQLSPTTYPYLVLKELAKAQLPQNDPLRELFFSEGFHSTKLSEAINAVSLMRRYFDGYFPIAKHNWAVCSDELKEVLSSFKWIDSEGSPWHRLFCDSPLEHLVADLLLGVYGYPYHVNVDKLQRLKYCAKDTTMFSDVIIFDQCRYMYDFVPTIPLFTSDLHLGVQFILRICMDRIRRHTYDAHIDLYQGSALAGLWEDGFTSSVWPDRVQIYI